MKKISILSLFFLLACQPQDSMTFSEQDIVDVKEASKQYGGAILAGDFAAIGALADPNVTLMPPGSAAVKGPAAVVEFMEQGPKVQGTIEPESVDGSGDLAYVRGNYSLTFQINDTTQASYSGKYIEVWRKQEDGYWKVQVDIWNSNSSPDSQM